MKLSNDIIIEIALFLLPSKDNCISKSNNKTELFFAIKYIFNTLKKNYLPPCTHIFKFYNKKFCKFHNNYKYVIIREFAESYKADRYNSYDIFSNKKFHMDNTFFFHFSEDIIKEIKDFNKLLREILKNTKFKIIGECCGGNGVQYTDI